MPGNQQNVFRNCGTWANILTRRHRTFALWLAGAQGHVEIMQELLRVSPESEARRLRVEVEVASQRLRLFRSGQLVFESPVSTGKKSHPTPSGDYVGTDKHRHWRSTLYDAEMPYFLRLSASDFGLHAGHLPGHPASHGCIRLPPAKAKELFAMVPPGTLVQIR
ncbi:MAG: L,D-transpeptidase [Terrimicrobiaceae bacterium]|nr:L,D-transpeptidase [Terrimicrobiaceae bacterium]